MGTVEIEPWQCIAELIDNALDGYLNSTEEWKKKYAAAMKIEIYLPTKEELENGTGEIIVKDTGPGMTPEELNNAVRAGWSGHEGYDRLGLFGMGFNVATAKLGNITRISSSKVEDRDRYWIEIDPHSMHEHYNENPQDAWLAPDGLEKSKHSTIDQGTTVTISQLKGESAKQLLVSANSAVNLRKRLGRIYSPLMQEHNIRVLIFKNNQKKSAGQPIIKWAHCIWDKKRTTRFKGQEMKRPEHISAFREVNINLPSQYYCTNCWKWFEKGEDVETCSQCESKGIDKRKREITGWIGVQRAFFGAPHTPQNHFGIDLVRNGRVIVELSKKFFDVTVSDGTSRIDYPVEGNYWGRIVGSLDISFCPTDFRKRGFEENDKNWIMMMKEIQGNGLRPGKTKDDGKEYIPTDLSIMVRAFGSDKISGKRQPGMNSLIAGKPKMAKGKPVLDSNGLPYLQADFSKHREYATGKFWKGDPEYQTDEKWYDDIEWAEEFDPEDWYDDWKEKNGVSDDDDEDKCKHGQNPKKCKKCNSGLCPHRMLKEKCTICNPFIISDDWQPDEYLSGTYLLDIKGVTQQYNVEAYYDEGKARPIDAPLTLHTKKRNQYVAVYQKTHPMFASYKEGALDYLLMEIASLSSKMNKKISYSESYMYLKQGYCADQKVDLATVKLSADRLIHQLKEHIVEEWNLGGQDFSSEVINCVEDHVARKEHKGEDVAAESMKDGTFVLRLSGRILFDEIIMDTKRVPMLLDGNFFDSEIQKITNAHRRRRIVSEYERYLSLICNVDDIVEPNYESLSAVQGAIIWLENRRI